MINVNLMSCGLDSTLGYLFLKTKYPEKKFFNIFIDTKSGYSYKEYDHFEKIMDRFMSVYKEDVFEIILPFEETFVISYLEKEDAYFLNRNLLLVIFAASTVHSRYPDEKIHINAFNNADDRVDDGSYEYYQRIVSANIIKGLHSIDLPLRNMSKIQLAKWFIEEFKNEKLFKNTEEKEKFLIEDVFSCYSNIEDDKGDLNECLSCKACFRKTVVLANVIEYIRPHYNKEMIEKYLNDNNMSEERKQSIRFYVEKLKDLERGTIEHEIY